MFFINFNLSFFNLSELIIPHWFFCKQLRELSVLCYEFIYKGSKFHRKILQKLIEYY